MKILARPRMFNEHYMLSNRRGEKVFKAMQRASMRINSGALGLIDIRTQLTKVVLEFSYVKEC